MTTTWTAIMVVTYLLASPMGPVPGARATFMAREPSADAKACRVDAMKMARKANGMLQRGAFSPHIVGLRVTVGCRVRDMGEGI